MAQLIQREKLGQLTRSLALQPYIFDVVHKAGLQNGNADSLSRSPTDIFNDKSVAGGRKDYFIIHYIMHYA